MILPAITLFLLLAQNAGPQQPVAPASIDGIAVKAGTGESLSKVTVMITRLPTQESVTLQGARGGGIDPAIVLPAALLPANNAVPNAPNSPRQSVTTGPDGKFLFENLRPGSYQLNANSPGYAPMEYGQRGPNGRGITFTLKAGQKMQNVALTLIPEGSITGRVVDSNGEPLRRALVQAHKVVYQERGRSLQTIQAVPSDDRGDFRLFWLPPGKYYISATPIDENARTMPVMAGGTNLQMTSLAAATLNNLVTLNSTLRDASVLPVAGLVPGIKITSTTLSNGEIVEEGTVPVYYPAAFDISKATPVEVRSGDITGGVNITASAARVFRIRGMMVDNATGKPLSASTINLVASNGPLISLAVPVQQTPNVSGFEISGVVPGSYILYGTVGNSGGQPGVGVSMVDVSSANVDNIVVPASSPILINGRVVIEGALANPNPNAGARLQISIRFEHQTLGMPAINVNVPVEPDGKFTVLALLPGDYRILVTGGSGLVPKSILYDGRDVQTEGIHIGGAAAGSLEIVLTNKGGRIEGNVMADRQRVANATVVLMPTFALRRQTNLYQTVQTNADGHYTIESIAPGAYKVFAWEDVPARAWFDAEFMRDFESQGREITIRESAMETLEIPVIPR